MTSVELLDEVASHWRDKPELPVGIYGAQAVEDPLGGTLIGGHSSINSFSDKLYQIVHAGEGARWIEMPQSKSDTSSSFILVVNCQNLQYFNIKK